MENRAAVHAFVTLQLFGSASFVVILLLTELIFRDNIRYPAWRSFCVSWVVFGCSYAVLTLAGAQFSLDVVGVRKDRALCTVQAGLIYAGPPLVANTTLALIVQLRSAMLYGIGEIEKPLSKLARVLIAVVPWIIWVINMIGVLVYAFRNPALIELNAAGTYCHIAPTTVSKVMGVWLAAVGAVAVGIEITLMLLMYRRGFRLAGQCNASRTAFRLGLFMLQAIVAIGFTLVWVVTESGSIALDILISIQPTIAAIIFGTRTSLLCPWSRRDWRGNKGTKNLDADRCGGVARGGSEQYDTMDSTRSSTLGRISWQQISDGQNSRYAEV